MGEVSSEKALGNAIQKARQRAGLTQQELCHVTALSYSTLAKIERGAIKSPSIFTVYKIAGAIGLSMDDLLGAVVDTPAPQTQKKTSKSGVSFVYFDINGCLVRFFHGAFTRLSQETGLSADTIESAFWHHNDAACRGDITVDEFNERFASSLGLKEIDWPKYYFYELEPIAEMEDLLKWSSLHYQVGLLSNIMTGFVEEMLAKKLLPNIHYDVIVDSSVVRAIKPDQTIYAIAEQRAGVPSEQILFIDDSRTNLMAAEHRGWKVLWFNSYESVDSVARIRSALEF